MELMRSYDVNYANPNSTEFNALETNIDNEVDAFFSSSSIRSRKEAFKLSSVNNTTSGNEIKIEAILLVEENDAWAASMLVDTGFQPNINVKAGTLSILALQPVSVTYMSKLILTTPLAGDTLSVANRKVLTQLFEEVMNTLPLSYEYKISYFNSRNYEKSDQIQETAVFMKIEIFSLVDDAVTDKSNIQTELKNTTSCPPLVNCSTAEVIIWETEMKKYRSAMVIEEKYNVEYRNKRSKLYLETLTAFIKGYKKIIQQIDIYHHLKYINDIYITDISDGTRHEMVFTSVLEVEHRSGTDFSRQLGVEILNLNNSRSFSGKKIRSGSQIFNEIVPGEIKFNLKFLVSDTLDTSGSSGPPYQEQQEFVKESVLTLFNQQSNVQVTVDKNNIQFSSVTNTPKYEVKIEDIIIESLIDVFQPIRDLLSKQKTSGVFGNWTLTRDVNNAIDDIEFTYNAVNCATSPPGQTTTTPLDCDTSGNKYCPAMNKCDDKQQCFNHEDEKDCDVTPNHYFKCDNDNALEPEKVCNGNPDCSNGEDEVHCPVSNCSTTDPVFVCKDNVKICHEKTCNGLKDCNDNEDEDLPWCTKNETCSAICQDSGKCGTLCDKIEDCNDGSDEKYCPDYNECRHPYIYKCDYSNTIICTNKMCDGAFDCDHKDDELKICLPCPSGYMKCPNIRTSPCVKVCDGNHDCPSTTSPSIDETNCPTNCRNETLDVFTCNDNTIICGEQKCDSIFDCSGKEDELINCDPCPAGYIKCEDSNGEDKCARLCDNTFECKDAADELFCPPTPCLQMDYYMCGNGSAICGEQLCDGMFHCSNNEDELMCDPCPLGYTRCDPDNKTESCVKKCDGPSVCSNGNDIAGCPNCDKVFMCENGAFICEDQKCNGKFDCTNKEDEKDCEKCPDKHVKCNMTGLCYKLCDQIYECPDGSDEMMNYCPECAPNVDVILCNNGTGICEDKKCDGNFDCMEKEDELDCPTCPNGYIKCNATSPCVKLCDGIKDCINGKDDEPSICPLCRTNDLVFECNDGVLICGEQQCDGNEDCSDREDELKCAECPLGYTKCEDSGECTKLCDGEYICNDGSDERDCPTCSDPNYFMCDNKTIICDDERCDGIFHCSEKEDEVIDCPRCPKGYRKCDNGEKCGKICDGNDDCLDLSDETIGCPICLHSEAFVCNNGTIICGENKCDGTMDCEDNEDEITCPVCPYGYKKCKTTDKCVPLCDMLYNCPDGSDETVCPKCIRPGIFLCSNGSIICHDQKCNGRPDCLNGEDERNCQSCAPGYMKEGEKCVERCNWIYESSIYDDEKRCPVCESPGIFVCLDGEEICEEYKCNGEPNCKGGEDEFLCETCPPGFHRTAKGDCVRRCDSRYESFPDKLDEYDCPKCKYPGIFVCRNGAEICREKKCDGTKDCPNGEDEHRCKYGICPPEFHKTYEGECVPRCDWIYQSYDGKDEENCPKCQLPGIFVCENEDGSTKDICFEQTCNNIEDCDHGQDEIHCFDCPPGFKRNVRGECVPRCDWISDNSYCPQNCSIPGIFVCSDGTEICLEKKCDGKPDCPLNQDENNCDECPPGRMKCSSSGKCVQRCTGQDLCADGKDNYACPRCQEPGIFPCKDGIEICPESRCNHYVDCEGNEDEFQCWG